MAQSVQEPATTAAELEKKSAPATGFTNAQYATLIATFLGWMFDGFEMGLFPLIARPALQDMLKVTDDKAIGAWMGNIYAVFLIGAALGGLLFGWLGDKIGRVRAMSFSILVYSGFTGVCYLAQEPTHLAFFRFIASLGMGGEWALGVALVMECWPDKYRPWLAGAIGAAANVGFLLVALVGKTFAITPQSWRWMFLVGAAPAALVFLIRIFVPESEKWKATVEKNKNAAKINPVYEIFSPALRKNTLLSISFASVTLIATWGAVQWIPPWADKLANPEVVALADGTLPPAPPRNTAAKAEAQSASALGAVVGCCIAPVIGGLLSRRLAFFLFSLASITLCSYLFRFVHAFNTEFMILTFLVGGATASFYAWFPLYLPELFPTRVRATGQGVSYNSGRVLAAAGALTSGSLVSYFGSYSQMAATICLVYLIGMVLIWFAPETKGKPLPE